MQYVLDKKLFPFKSCLLQSPPFCFPVLVIQIQNLKIVPWIRQCIIHKRGRCYSNPSPKSYMAHLVFCRVCTLIINLTKKKKHKLPMSSMSVILPPTKWNSNLLNGRKYLQVTYVIRGYKKQTKNPGRIWSPFHSGIFMQFHKYMVSILCAGSRARLHKGDIRKCY